MGHHPPGLDVRRKKQMKVQVSFELRKEPTDAHFSMLRADAGELTDDLESIAVERVHEGAVSCS